MQPCIERKREQEVVASMPHCCNLDIVIVYSLRAVVVFPHIGFSPLTSCALFSCLYMCFSNFLLSMIVPTTRLWPSIIVVFVFSFMMSLQPFYMVVFIRLFCPRYGRCCPLFGPFQSSFGGSLSSRLGQSPTSPLSCRWSSHRVVLVQLVSVSSGSRFGCCLTAPTFDRFLHTHSYRCL